MADNKNNIDKALEALTGALEIEPTGEEVQLEPDKGVSFDDIWTNITPESIDYGVMEKAKNIIVVKAKFDWSDLGSWNIIHDISPKNKDGNTIRGDALIIKGRNNFVQSNGQFIALLGLDNVVVITTDDATLVVAKDQVEEVKNVVKYLKDDKKENLL